MADIHPGIVRDIHVHKGFVYGFSVRVWFVFAWGGYCDHMLLCG